MLLYHCIVSPASACCCIKFQFAFVSISKDLVFLPSSATLNKLTNIFEPPKTPSSFYPAKIKSKFRFIWNDNIVKLCQMLRSSSSVVVTIRRLAVCQQHWPPVKSRRKLKFKSEPQLRLLLASFEATFGPHLGSHLVTFEATIGFI